MPFWRLNFSEMPNEPESNDQTIERTFRTAINLFVALQFGMIIEWKIEIVCISSRRRCDLKVSTGRSLQPPRLIWLIRSPSGLLTPPYSGFWVTTFCRRCSPFSDSFIHSCIVLVYVTSWRTTLDAKQQKRIKSKDLMRSFRWKISNRKHECVAFGIRFSVRKFSMRTKR